MNPCASSVGSVASRKGDALVPLALHENQGPVAWSLIFRAGFESEHTVVTEAQLAQKICAKASLPVVVTDRTSISEYLDEPNFQFDVKASNSFNHMETF